MTIGKRLIFGTLGIIVLAGLLGAVAIVSLNRVNRVSREVVKRNNLISIYSNQIGIALLQSRRNEKNYLLRGEDKYVREVEKNVGKMKENLGYLQRLVLDRELMSRMEQISSIVDQYHQEFLKVVQDVKAGLPAEEAFSTRPSFVSLGRKIEPLAKEIASHARQEIRGGIETITRTKEHTDKIITATFIGILFLITSLAIILFRSITRPLHKLTEGARIIGTGNLDYRIKRDKKAIGDEIEKLTDVFNRMTENLKATTISKEYVERKAAELEKAYRDLEALKEELQERMNDLNILFEMNRHISIRLYLSDILEYVAKSAPETMGAEICVILVWDEIKDRLIPKAVTWLSPKELENIPFLLGEGLEGWIGLEKKLANIQDVSEDPRWKDKLPYPVDKVKTALFCPILIGERLLGVIGLINKVREKAFNHSDESLLMAIGVQLAVAMENAILYERVSGLSLGTIRSLAKAIDARDPYTKGHSEQVAKYAVMLSKALNFSQAGIEMMEYAGLLHDTGKIDIPGEILNKPGSLTHEDWDKIKLHPYLSRQILIPVESLHKILPWIYHHHEKPDGQGYPNGLSGKEIPLEAKILAVADTFSALTSDRPYRKAKTKEEAIEELRRVAGTQLDPKIVEVFIKCLTEEASGDLP